MQLFLFISFQKASLSLADECGLKNVVIKNATSIEILKTCQALDQVIQYFLTSGISLDPEVTYDFEDVLTVKMDGEDYPVYGFFDSDTRVIKMVHFASPQQQDKTAWGQSWDVDVATSFLVHESTHMYVIEAMGNHFKEIPPHWHEAIAYAVQFENMNSDLRAKIVNGGVQAFENPGSVSDVVYEMNPNIFAVKSYLGIHDWGGALFIKKIVEGGKGTWGNGFLSSR